MGFDRMGMGSCLTIIGFDFDFDFSGLASFVLGLLECSTFCLGFVAFFLGDSVACSCEVFERDVGFFGLELPIESAVLMVSAVWREYPELAVTSEVPLASGGSVGA